MTLLVGLLALWRAFIHDNRGEGPHDYPLTLLLAAAMLAGGWLLVAIATAEQRFGTLGDPSLSVVAHLRARAARLELTANLLFMVAGCVLVATPVVYLKVDSLLAEEAELAEPGIHTAVETRAQLGSVASERREISRRISSAFAEKNGLPLNVPGVPTIVGDASVSIAEFEAHVPTNGPSVAAPILDWVRLERRREEAVTRWESASQGSPEEVAADHQRMTLANQLSELVAKNPALQVALDGIRVWKRRERERTEHRREAIDQDIRALSERDETLKVIEQSLMAKLVQVDPAALISDLALEPEEPSARPIAQPAADAGADVPQTLTANTAGVDGGTEDGSEEPTSIQGAVPVRPDASSSAVPQAAPLLRAGLITDAGPADSGPRPEAVGRTRRYDKDDLAILRLLESHDFHVILGRIGLVAFMLMLVQALLTLQRYLVRLASYYAGRADALTLLGLQEAGAWDGTNLRDRLAVLKLLTPSLQPGKSPKLDVKTLEKTAALLPKLVAPLKTTLSLAMGRSSEEKGDEPGDKTRKTEKKEKSGES